MKKLLSVFFIAALFAGSSCTGPIGPQGFQGPEGPQGVPGGIEFAKAFEITTNFTAANEYSLLEPYGFEVFESDVTLVYVLWDVLENGDAVWRLLPQTAYLTDGILTYNYDFTLSDVSIFLDGTVPNFATVPEGFRIDQTFRVVVIPTEFASAGRQDFTYEKITQAFNISEASFKKRDLR
ncbi:MAG: collagen-like protein [Spirosomaceae bacterium]|nr:collagen-like protein [Spirosomataceae bacterium]